ncbi:MAG: tetratricopeptide repeat protein [Syntrophobacterales bacterium]|jgi:tetratricopeptide (TPR) repeat protein
MKRLLFYLASFIWLVALPAHAEDANEYFKQAMRSSRANEKIEYLSKALELDPNLADAYEKRGMLYYYQEKYDKVIQDFENYTRLVPDDIEGFRMLAMGYLYYGTYDAAIATFTQALKLDPQLVSALSYRAEAYRRSGNGAEAVRQATKVIQRGGDPRVVADAYITRAKVYREIGQQEQAVADVRAALQIDPRTWFYRYVSDYANLEDIRGAGLVAILVIVAVLIFKFRLRAPNKEE